MAAHPIDARIDGEDKAYLDDPDGAYDFIQEVSYQSKLVVDAPKGSVIFSSPPGAFNEGSKIDGQSHVLLQASNIVFNAKIDGQSWVFIVVSKGGSIIANDRITGGSNVFWKKASLDDPTPSIKLDPEPGKGVTVQEITDAKIWDFFITNYITNYSVPK